MKINLTELNATYVV